MERRADPNAKALNGWNPLHVCCKKNRLEIARLLITYGANVSARTTSGLTPLHLAAYSGALDIVKVFVETNNFKLRSFVNFGLLSCATVQFRQRLFRERFT